MTPSEVMSALLAPVALSEHWVYAGTLPDGTTYSTDSAMLITDRTGEWRPPPNAVARDEVAGAISGDGGAQPITLVDVMALVVTVHDEECDTCGGSGNLLICSRCLGSGRTTCNLDHEHDCPECDGGIAHGPKGILDPCEDCHHQGAYKTYDRIRVGDGWVLGRYVWLMQQLPGLSLLTVGKRSQPCRAEWERGIVLVMQSQEGGARP